MTGTSRARFGLGPPPLVSGLRVGLLGGSFDPPHEGHVHVSEWAIRSLGLHQVWWLVAPRNPLKERTPASIGRRLSAAKERVIHPRVVITDLEAMIGSNHTATTLAYLKLKHPSVRFVWLMGSDNLETFDKWQRWRDIARCMPFAVFSRPGHRVSAAFCPAARMLSRSRIRAERAPALAGTDPPAWAILSGPLCGRSSTDIRRCGGWNS